MSGVFEKAARQKLRFDTPAGRLSAEDLWDLPLVSNKVGTANLDDIAKVLYKELKDSDQGSFVLKTTRLNERLQLQFDLVKHVIDTLLREREAAENAEKLRQRKQRIMEIMAEKEDEHLKEASVEELRALLETM